MLFAHYKVTDFLIELWTNRRSVRAPRSSTSAEFTSAVSYLTSDGGLVGEWQCGGCSPGGWQSAGDQEVPQAEM